MTVTSRIAIKGSDRFVTVVNFGSGTLSDGRYANADGLRIDGNQIISDVFDPAEFNRSPFGYTYSTDGVALDGEFATARNLIVQNFRGIGIGHRIADCRIFDCVARGCYIGAKLPSSDSEIRGCRLFNCRDACLWIAANSGNCVA